jgi:hypothetical protein
MKTEDMIRRTIEGTDEAIKASYARAFSEEINMFVKFMTVAYDRWRKVDSIISKTEEKAYIAALAYSAINQHIISFKLFISGYWVPSGNVQRQVFESAAMALLASKIELGYLERFIKGKYSTNNAIRDVKKQYKKLSLDKNAVEILAEKYKFYHKFSHITFVTIASSISAPYEGKTVSFLGSVFDPRRMEIYKKEVNSKVGFANILPNIIEGIELNLGLL